MSGTMKTDPYWSSGMGRQLAEGADVGLTLYLVSRFGPASTMYRALTAGVVWTLYQGWFGAKKDYTLGYVTPAP